MVLTLILVIIVMMVMAATLRVIALVIVLVVLVMMVVMRLFLELCKLNGDGTALLHGLHQLFAGQLVPRCRDNDRVLVVLTDHGLSLIHI